MSKESWNLIGPGTPGYNQHRVVQHLKNNVHKLGRHYDFFKSE